MNAPDPLPLRKPKPIPPPAYALPSPERELLERLAVALAHWART